MSQNTVEVRGYTIFNKPASTSLKVFAGLIDVCFVVAVTVSLIVFFHWTPLPQLPTLITLPLVGAIYWFSQKYLFGITLGHRVWQLKSKTGSKELLQKTVLAPAGYLLGGFLTLTSILATLLSIQTAILKHPIWLSGSPYKIAPYLPTPGEWTVTPFFYALGGWPKTFHGKPIVYTLPYEKGPPTRFVGHIFADLEIPDIKLILEGPKTPDKAEDRATLKKCFLTEKSYHCLTQKDISLGRHIREIQALSPREWSLKWFNVETPFISAENQVQGIYLNSVGESWIQDRFILINNNNVQQAIILHRNKEESGNQAFGLLQKTIGSLRLFNELDSGRTWIDRELGTVQLNPIQKIQDDTQYTKQLAEIQTYLISKISVDPASFDSYFHLAGTSLLFAKRTSKYSDSTNRASKRNIESAYQFAADIAPDNKKTQQIQEFLFEIKKK